MRVLVITKIFPSEAEPAFASYNFNQFGELSRLCELEVLAIVPWFPGRMLAARLLEGGSSPRIPRRSRLGGLNIRHPRVLYVPRVGQAFAGHTYAASLLPYVALRRGQVDVVLGAFAYPDGWAAVKIGQLLGVPTVVKVHGSDLNVFSRDPKLQPRLRQALSSAAAVVAPSEKLIELAKEYGANPTAARVIRNGVDRQLFRVRDRTASRISLGRNPETQVLLYVGRLEPAKGIFELLEAFAVVSRQRPNVELVLIGEGVAEGECQRLARERQLRVHFAGSCSRDQVATWLGAADLLTLPSWTEGTPNVVLEALASGRRVVASSVGGIPAVVTNDVLGELVPPKAPDELAAALGRAIDNSYDMDRVATSADLMDWAASAGQLHAVLERATRG